MPERIQLRRTKGWRKPDGAIVVARPTMWGNPFSEEKCGSRAEAVKLFRAYLTKPQTWLLERAGPIGFGLSLIVAREKVKRHMHELRGKDLCCWCPLDQPCHADVLLSLANKVKV